MGPLHPSEMSCRSKCHAVRRWRVSYHLLITTHKHMLSSIMSCAALGGTESARGCSRHGAIAAEGAGEMCSVKEEEKAQKEETGSWP